MVRLSGGALARVLGLLGISVLINYVDRGNLAVAAPLLKEELHISASQLGILLAAFFWTYTAFMPLSGWIVDRFDVNWVLAAGFVIWSMATAATGLVHGLYMLVVVRMLLGVGESVAFPSYGRVLACHVPQQHRGIANAIIITGMSLGPAIGTYACGMWMARYGWRSVFVVIGFVSLIWVLPWLRWMPKNSVAEQQISHTVPTIDIMRQRSFWGAAIGHFCSNYPLYFMITWLPYYLVHERHQSMQAMAKEASLFYVAFAVVAPLVAWMADACVRAGLKPNVVRKTSMAVGHIIVATAVLGCGALDARVSFGSLITMGMGCGFVGPNIYVFAQTLAGAAAAGKWTGLQNAVGNLAGVIVAPLSGLIADRTGQFWWAFVICAVVAVFGALSWVLLVGPLDEVAWPNRHVLH